MAKEEVLQMQGKVTQALEVVFRQYAEAIPR